MVSRIISAVIVTALCLSNQKAAASKDSFVGRTKKDFSLFSVVTFKNEECTSESSLVGGARKGTCYTASECSDKSGTKSGNCAAGFGVCCIFISSTGASATIKYNRTHIRNSEYPSYATSTTKAASVVYTVNKEQSDICQLRLDFNTFVITGPSNSAESITVASYNHNCRADQIVIATSDLKSTPTNCGILTGQHLYIDLSPTATDTATITITTSFTTANEPTPAIAKRIWDFEVAQIPCYASYRAPHGCDRYFMTDSGKITSLNFYKVSGSTLASTGATQNSGLELASQNLNTCIRRSKGMCCVEYRVCVVDEQGITLTDTTGTTATTEGTEGIFSAGFSVDTNVGTGGGWDEDEYSHMGMFDAQCSKDYVEIPSSYSGTCGGTADAQINTRYCGALFGANTAYQQRTYSSPGVCDCSEPFSLRHGSDMYSDKGGAGGSGSANANILVASRGFCIDYLQKPCSA